MLFSSDPTPSISSVTYSVDSATTGRLMITTLSPGAYGTTVTYSGSVVEGSGSVVVVGNVLTVTGLDYTLSHTVNITGASGVCAGLQGSNQTSYTFNIARKLSNADGALVQYYMNPVGFIYRIGTDVQCTAVYSRNHGRF